MADIDMIPRSYRDGVRVRRTLRRAGMALTAITLAAAAGIGALRWQSAALERRTVTLQQAASAAQTSQAQAATVQAARERLLAQQGLLRALRREGELAALAAAIDSALPANAWLTAINLQRDLQLATAPPATATTPAPAPDSRATTFATGNADGGTLVMVSSVELAGQAADYNGITDFLSNLGRMPGMHGVELLSSSANPSTAAIDFRAVVVLIPPAEAP
ncbi:Tfp pilus assembly protein PilN [Massilia aurea]|uniref:Tfp pilus assembly protein PilN n=1 Tax=Massilia aurea TaxID=373040 RepID=A0A7X0CFB0_9BURK|nr:PilN domain-containing protein [Massilia aurea]MBB6135055.1 Tfp pilus assembly protein PilN [Massilia aurea]